MNIQSHNRATRIANTYLKTLPVVEASFGKQGQATAAIYDDGVLLYLTLDPNTEQSISVSIRKYIVEEGHSNDGSVTVFVLDSDDWEHALNMVSGIVALGSTDNRQSDRHKIDQYVELIEGMTNN